MKKFYLNNNINISDWYLIIMGIMPIISFCIVGIWGAVICTAVELILLLLSGLIDVVFPEFISNYRIYYNLKLLDKLIDEGKVVRKSFNIFKILGYRWISLNSDTMMLRRKRKIIPIDSEIDSSLCRKLRKKIRIKLMNINY